MRAVLARLDRCAAAEKHLLPLASSLNGSKQGGQTHAGIKIPPTACSKSVLIVRDNFVRRIAIRRRCLSEPASTNKTWPQKPTVRLA